MLINSQLRRKAINRILSKLNKRMRKRWRIADQAEWEGYEIDYDYWIKKKKYET